ncbi:MAG TPA: hypothetical protein DCG32_08740, partial [Sphaerochaeta sp.]|nr:hypothetical protein [Sphaerochaeta sp.]
HLKESNDKRSESSDFGYFPWGTQQTLSSAPSWVFQKFTITKACALGYEKHDTHSEQWTVVRGSVSSLGSLYAAGESLTLDQKGLVTFEVVGPGTELLVLRMHSEPIRISGKEER